MFAIVLAAAAMVSCAGNANKTAEECTECTECCAEGEACTKPVEEQCAACKEAAQTVEGAVTEAAVEAVNKAAEEVAKAVKGE